MSGDSTRNAYLEALGIDRWIPRDAVPEPFVAPDPPAPIASREARAPAAREPAAREPATREPAARTLEPRPAPTQDWTELRERVAGCVRCGLCESRTQTVFGVGSEQADWLVIGEAPGAEEDRRGEPFVGRAGQLLNSMLIAIGLARETVFIANILKCRPPGNRDPKPEEVSQCLPYLTNQIALLKPKIILAVGRIAAQNLLATDAPLARLRGKLHSFGEAGTPLVITYHPAYLLRTPADKRKAWEDLKFARATYTRIVSGNS
jgi:uracil-DNA glycosylase family 4